MPSLAIFTEDQFGGSHPSYSAPGPAWRTDVARIKQGIAAETASHAADLPDLPLIRLM